MFGLGSNCLNLHPNLIQIEFKSKKLSLSSIQILKMFLKTHPTLYLVDIRLIMEKPKPTQSQFLPL